MSAPHITPFSVTPDPKAGRATFDEDVATYHTELNGFVSEANDQADFVNAAADQVALDKAAAATSASNSATSASQAAASATAAASVAPAWVSGGDYETGETAFSPITFQTYRAKTDHTGETTDPSLDTANWALLGADPDELELFSLWTGA